VVMENSGHAARRVMITGITGFVAATCGVPTRQPPGADFGIARWRSRRDKIEHLDLNRIHLIECDLNEPIRCAPDSDTARRTMSSIWAAQSLCRRHGMRRWTR